MTVSMNETNAGNIELVWNILDQALFVIDKQGTILERNSAAENLFPTNKFTYLSDIVKEKDTLIQTIKQISVDGEFIELDSLSAEDKDDNPIQLCLRLTPLNKTDRKNTRLFLAAISQKSKDLDSLEKVARSNEERVVKLSEKLKYVTRELVEKTKKVAEQKNKLDAIINGMGDGLVACDEKGSIIQYNDTACSLLLIPEKDVQGKIFADLFPSIADAIVLDSNRPTSMTKREANVSYENKELRVCASPLFDQESNHFGFVLIIQDRTKQAEIDRMKSDLISIVSHELRSPLTSIKGYVDLMVAGDLGEVPESMKSYLSIVSTNASKLAALIDDMLDLSRIESGKLVMSFGKVEIKYLCDYVYLTLKPQAEQKNHDFQLYMETKTVVSGDVDRLQQALTNLVSNAIKYTPEGGSVEIRAGTRNGKALISVKDSGIGISPENQKKLFQKFYRVKNDKTRNIGGTGLGLCIAESIIKAHEGRITLKSSEGQGSTFEIELPTFHA